MYDLYVMSYAVFMDETPDWWQPHAAKHPNWHAWLGVNGLYYARRPKTSPPLVVTGEDPQDLSDEIVKALARRDGVFRGVDFA